MGKNFVLRMNDKKDGYYLDYIKPWEELYMAANSCECLEISLKKYENMEQKFFDFFKTLTAREANITVLYYGFLGKKYSVEQIAKIMKVCPERILELKNRVLYKVKKRHICGSPISNAPMAIYKRIETPIIDYRAILINDICVHLNNESKVLHYLKRILEKNKLSIRFSPETKAHIKMITIDDMDLSVRTYNCLKRAGIKDVFTLLSLTDEELCQIRNLGHKSIQEIKDKIKQYDFEREKLKKSEDIKYIAIECIYNSYYKKWEIPMMSKEDVAELVYEMIVKECSEWNPLVDFNLSVGLINFLLIRGNLFVEELYVDYEQIINELKYLGHKEYLKEFENFLSAFRKYAEDEGNKKVRIICINQEIKKRIASRRISNQEVLGDLYKNREKTETGRSLFGDLLRNQSVRFDLIKIPICKDKFKVFLTCDLKLLEEREENILYSDESDIMEIEDFAIEELEIDEDGFSDDPETIKEIPDSLVYCTPFEIEEGKWGYKWVGFCYGKRVLVIYNPYGEGIYDKENGEYVFVDETQRRLLPSEIYKLTYRVPLSNRYFLLGKEKNESIEVVMNLIEKGYNIDNIVMQPYLRWVNGERETEKYLCRYALKETGKVLVEIKEDCTVIWSDV